MSSLSTYINGYGTTLQQCIDAIDQAVRSKRTDLNLVIRQPDKSWSQLTAHHCRVTAKAYKLSIRFDVQY